jgi:hypothetical protein
VLAAASSISAYTLVHGHTPWSLWVHPKQTTSSYPFSKLSFATPVESDSRSTSCIQALEVITKPHI